MTLPQPVGNRFVGLEIGRGIAALFITLFYATGFYEKYFGVSVFGNPFRGGHAGFEYFFVLAGFLPIPCMLPISGVRVVCGRSR